MRDLRAGTVKLAAATTGAVTALFLLASCGASSESPAHWSYAGEEGPEHWGELDPSYAPCADGTDQSAIDLGGATSADLADLELAYRAGEAEVEDTGHSTQANAPPGSTLTVEGVEYPLVQMHFHAPSEHTLDDEHSRVEAHFVHRTEAGKLAVVGVMLTEGESPNEAWQPFVEALTVGEGDTVAAELDWEAMLPDDRSTFRYEGSLTTPPCTEGVRWLVMWEPVLLAADQLAAFEEAYSGNNRPVQPLNGRVVEIDTADR